MRRLGNTDLKVHRLGLGLLEIDSLRRVEDAGKVLNTALDCGINFLDTAACYGVSEEFIGRAIKHRRNEYFLATKCGHVTGGYEGTPWSAQTITDSIDRSLKRMKTDYLDLVQLHSCNADILEQGDATQALLVAKQAGKTRYIGYSGDNHPAYLAVETGLFDTLQTTFNIVDQNARSGLFALAKKKDMGIIAKRPIANAAWARNPLPLHSLILKRLGSIRHHLKRYPDLPMPGLSFFSLKQPNYEYLQRAQIMREAKLAPNHPIKPIRLSLGFVLAHTEIDTVIVGSRSCSHILENIEIVENMNPIPSAVVEELHDLFNQVGNNWCQLT